MGLKVEGDAEAIGKIVDRLGLPFDSDSDGDVSPSGGRRLPPGALDDGGLGKTNVYQRAVPDSGRRGDGGVRRPRRRDVVDQRVADDDELAADLEPLQALGASARGPTGHHARRHAGHHRLRRPQLNGRLSSRPSGRGSAVDRKTTAPVARTRSSGRAPGPGRAGPGDV